MHHMTLISFRLPRKNLGNLREFLGKWFTAPPGKKLPVRLCRNMTISKTGKEGIFAGNWKKELYLKKWPIKENKNQRMLNVINIMHRSNPNFNIPSI